MNPVAFSCLLLLALSLSTLGHPAHAQASRAPSPSGPATQASTPEVVADEFHRAFQSMAWRALVQRIHPDGLAYLRLAVDILVEIDPGSWVVGTLLSDVGPADYGDLPDHEVVVRVLQGVQTQAPGLLSSLVSRRTRVLGTVPEGESGHVVYRTLALVAGAEARTEVMTLRRHEGRWRVAEAPDLQVLHTAIRGIPIPPAPVPHSGASPPAAGDLATGALASRGR